MVDTYLLVSQHSRCSTTLSLTLLGTCNYNNNAIILSFTATEKTARNPSPRQIRSCMVTDCVGPMTDWIGGFKSADLSIHVRVGSAGFPRHHSRGCRPDLALSTNDRIELTDLPKFSEKSVIRRKNPLVYG